MPRVKFRCDAALESIEGISDSPERESYNERHELVDFTIVEQLATLAPGKEQDQFLSDFVSSQVALFVYGER